MLRAALFLFLSAALAWSQAFSLSSLQGRWTGTLNQGILNLRVAIQFDRNGAGKLQVLDHPAPAIAVTAAKVQGYRVAFRVDSVGAYFDGIVMNEGNRLDGQWHQGATLPLVLARDGLTPTLRRPQTPQPPFPYTERNVKFASLARGIFLDGTLTVPSGPGPFPAVYLITGSGPQDRDETNLGHKPFRVIADYLSRRGVVVLRADDRGAGKSNGDFSSATTRDFADDAAGAVQFLKSREFVSRIGLIGHSEGGIIAPMVASDPALGARDVDFLVLLAAPGVPGDQVIIEQQMLVSRAMGVPEMLIERNREQEQKILSIARLEEDPELARSKMRAALGDFGNNPLNLLSLRLDEATSPWFRFLINYDPGPALRALKQPVLALNGSLDVQVPPAQNLPAITWELETGANPDYEVVKLAGLNHFFQTAETGSPAEYGQLEETISPAVLNLIGEWIARHAAAVERKPVLGGTGQPRAK